MIFKFFSVVFWGPNKLYRVLFFFLFKIYHCTYFSGANLFGHVLQCLEACSSWALEMLLLNPPQKCPYQFEDGQGHAFENVSEGTSSLGFYSWRGHQPPPRNAVRGSWSPSETRRLSLGQWGSASLALGH